MGEGIQYAIFPVNERYHCFWDFDLQSVRLKYIESIDWQYFEYVANMHLEHIDDEDAQQYAAISLRMAFSQGLETLFSLLCAYIQAPHCVVGWMQKYQNRDIADIVSRISDSQPMPNFLQDGSRVNWRKVADAVLAFLVLEDKEKETAIKSQFATLWTRFATQYLQEDFQKEYNSLKHGFRVRAGGFYLAFGRQDDINTPAPPERMQLFGHSEFGSSFFISERIGTQRRHFRLKRMSRNWSPEDMAWALHMISTSIANIVSSLKILNGVPAETVNFVWPDDVDKFQEPWKRSRQMGVTSMGGFDAILLEEFIKPFSNNELERLYIEGAIQGTHGAG